MTNPAPPPEANRTCPNCRRQAAPGFKFCEACGTRIPSLLTCSKCGTRFIHSTTKCELCGAPLIPEETGPETVMIQRPEKGEQKPEPVTVVIQRPDREKIPGPAADDMQEPEEEEIPEPAEERILKRHSKEIREPDTDDTPEPGGGEIAGPDSGDLQEPEEEEIPEPAEERILKRHSKEIREPDTAELLAKFGDESGDDESREPSCRSGSAPPVPHDPKKPVTGWRSWFRGREKPVSVDEALFLPDAKAKPARQPKNRMRIIGGAMMLAAVLIAVYFIGLPILSGTGILPGPGSPTAEITPVPGPATAEDTPALTATPTAAAGALVTRPTEQVPIDQKYYFQVQKNPVTARISVIFIGSSGEGSITRADIKVSHADGSVSTGIILPLKGMTEITLNGSDETDRVEIIATLSSGETYRVYDSLFPSVGRI